MITLEIQHTTTYRFNEPVSLLPHRLMLRPRESRDVRLLSSRISTAPDAVLSWASDVFGNAVTTATFSRKASTLVISSVANLQLASVEWPIFDIAVSATSYPFLYSDHDWGDLGALATPQFADAEGTLRHWAHMFVRGSKTDTLALLKDLSVGVSEAARYQSREEEGTQTPLETLSRGWGSCRDLAVLFAEAARVLGFGARIVSGYLYNPNQQSAGSGGAGSTHAWAEIFVPGAGWITFDPTNRSLGGFNLVPIAVARDIRQIAPVSGSYIASTDAFAGMSVEVLVTS
ncbi:transglutaminase family protein [Bradyrhizobium daqingense]|uniref:Transglutaminase-like putative cysteine protease n=1 Tax=Bradyrhizobium daqingense TaxID=993502 RepID=A0A562L2V8_9BRAD|nr:transglutaminase family protein [Bradyrhizobium daqingense]TWI01955.1 transglutaminase-like putative cysteine protease [Bradyrhizobium daqingense]UFS88664.1 transglutaminase family protein [Bradyrhizobium daqingense]